MKKIVYVVALLFCISRLMAQEQSVSVPPARIAPTDGPQPWTYPIEYDPSGNITRIRNDYYVYDPMGRLTEASVVRDDQAGAQTLTYSYDVYGNRVTRNGAAYSASATTNQLTAFGAAYDGGNLVQWQPPGSGFVRSYAYDSLNMLNKEVVDTKTILHVYTADDERLWQYNITDNVSRWTVRDLDGSVLRDFRDDPNDGSGSNWEIVRDYVYRNGALLAAITSTGATHHYSLDHLGSPRLITDANKYKVFYHHYLPFGEEWTIGGEPLDEATLRFTGHERDADRKNEPAGALDYMHARFYSGNLGRFLSTDPKPNSNSRNPGLWNRYAYVSNTPVRLIDPDGLEPLDPNMRPFLEWVHRADLSKVQVHGGWFARLLTNRNIAITFGNHVFFSRQGWREYRARSDIGIAWTAHETTHTMQARAAGGTLPFLALYLAQWASAGFDYWKIPYEKEGFTVERSILLMLAVMPGLLESIQQGTFSASTVSVSYPAPGTAGSSVVYSSPHAGGMSLSDLYGFRGTIFMDGVDMTILFSQPGLGRGRL